MVERTKPLKKFFKLLELDKRDIKHIIFYAIFSGLVALSLPLGIQAIINLIQGAQISSSWVILVIIVTLGVAFQGVLQIMQIRILENVRHKIFTRSSFEFAYRLPKLDLSQIQNKYAPELANRFFDTLTLQKGLNKILLEFPTAILQILFGLILLSFYHSFFIIFSFFLLFVLYILFKYTSITGLSTSLEESKKKYQVAHWLQEVARSLKIFKLSSKTNLSMNRNDEYTSAYLDKRESHFKVLLIQFIQLVGFKVLITAGLLIIGGLLVLNQQMNIGQFVAAEIIIILIINSVEKLIFGLENIYDVLTSIEKIAEITDIKLDKDDGIDPFEYSEEFNLSINDVGYVNEEGDKVLKKVNLEINSQKRILITGSAGSGKTLLLNIISGLIPPTEGVCYINDNSLKGVNPKLYQRAIGMVTSEDLPFAGTIKENICFDDKNINNDFLIEVLKGVGLFDFIKQQKDGLQTMVQAEGKNLPRTIIKKIALARAIVKQPKALILKDLLENFKKEEAESIIAYLLAEDKKWCLVVVDHNPIWDKYCDVIYKLSDKTLKESKNA